MVGFAEVSRAMMAYGNGMLKEVHFSSHLFAFHRASKCV